MDIEDRLWYSCKNDGRNSYDISRGDKVAQLVLLKSFFCDITESQSDLKDESETSTKRACARMERK